MLREYLQHISDVARQGDAREESYYSGLEGLLEEYADSVGRKSVHITVLPKKTEAGNPDFRIWDGRQHVIGYIEAKKPTEENLDHIQNSDQLERYRHTFPNLILTNFFEAAQLGKRLVELHLMKSPELDPPIARLQPIGSNKVEKPRFSEKQKRVYINDDQYFEGIEPEVFAYQIGGYQVLDKWLKDRKSRTLSLDDITHYCRVVTALAKTIDIQREIDVLYPELEEDTLAIESPEGENACRADE